ncbi:aspartate/glutamate racemase family protein [Marinobacter salarius]|uniref:aspartate/glutamate racemase family protein n=1 Tax=Marinobacter salarius TaxID=1420917 RepID=UPI0032EBF6DC
MKTIGLLGGMTWESSALYYRLINEAVREIKGSLHSAELLLYSVDFSEIEEMQRTGDWAGAGYRLAERAVALERAGADMLLLCTNTMHKVADTISSAISIPFLHIAEPTGNAIAEAGLTRIALLGTVFTMEQEFYKGYLQKLYGLDVMVPDLEERETIHRIIYEELSQGTVSPSSRDAYLSIITHMADNGAQGVILGCTEIGLLVTQKDTAIPLFDTTRLHAQFAVKMALC